MSEVSPPVVSAAIKQENGEKTSSPKKTAMEKVTTQPLLQQCVHNYLKILFLVGDNSLDLCQNSVVPSMTGEVVISE